MIGMENTAMVGRSDGWPKIVGSVFIGGPFLGLVDPVTGVLPMEQRTRFSDLIDYFERRGVTVHNAHRREDWGARSLGATEATELDYAEIAKSDLFVAYPGAPASPGTHVEIGWASALGKPMILLLGVGHSYAFLVTGLSRIANVEYIRFEQPAEICELLDNSIRRVVRRQFGHVAGAQ
jgi:hypothetical protein